MNDDVLKQIIEGKSEYDPSFVGEKIDSNHKYYYSVLLNEQAIYNITTDETVAGNSEVEYFDGLYISRITHEQLDKVMAVWQFLIINSKEYRKGLTEEEIIRYDFCGEYLLNLS